MKAKTSLLLREIELAAAALRSDLKNLEIDEDRVNRVEEKVSDAADNLQDAIKNLWGK